MHEFFHDPVLNPHDAGGGSGHSINARQFFQPLRGESMPSTEFGPSETIEAILVDNRSDQAEQNRQEFTEKRMKGELAFEIKCGDAREVTLNPNESYVDNRIAAAINPEIAEGAFNSPAVQFAIFVPHFDGGLFVPERMPPGCGGQGAKAELARFGRQDEEDQLEQFISERIRHQDFIVNTMELARELARLAKRGQPVIVTPQDHRTGEVRPLVVYQKDRGIIRTIEPEGLHLPLDGQYRPEEIYADGVPFMEDEHLPENIQGYLNRYRINLLKLKEDNPNFYDEQATQNPRFIFFSTDLKDFKVWLPHIGHRPNVGFRLTVPRRRIGADVQLSERDMLVAFAQSEYVMRESVSHAEEPGKAFHDTRTMVIMTGNYKTSQEFALGLAQRVQESAHRRKKKSWLALPNRQIIIGQINAGHITKIGEVDFEVRGGELIRFEDRAYNIAGQRVPVF